MNKTRIIRTTSIWSFVVLALFFAVSVLKSTGQAGKYPVTLDSGEEIYTIETFSVTELEHFNRLPVQGFITIIDFTADWCAICKRLARFEETLVAVRDDVLIRKIDVSTDKDFQLALNKYQLNFNAVPYSIVYDKQGKVVAQDNNRQLLGQRFIHSLNNE